MSNVSKIKIVSTTNGPNHLLITIEGHRPYQCVGEFKLSNGIIAFNDYSSGNQSMLYSCIDKSGSVAGMRKNFGWKNDTVVKAHGSWVNINRSSITGPIDALIFLVQKTMGHDVKRIVNKELTVQYDMERAMIIKERYLEKEAI